MRPCVTTYLELSVSQLAVLGAPRPCNLHPKVCHRENLNGSLQVPIQVPALAPRLTLHSLALELISTGSNCQFQMTEDINSTMASSESPSQARHLLQLNMQRFLTNYRLPTLRAGFILLHLGYS